MFYPHQLITVSEQRNCGLILCKGYYADFAGPGAAICSPAEQHYTEVYAIGSPELVLAKTPQARQTAYGRRIQWIRWLYKMTDYPDPMIRTEKLLGGFEAFFGDRVVAELPDEVLALLIGVLPQTVRLVRQQQGRSFQAKGSNYVSKLDWASEKFTLLKGCCDLESHKEYSCFGEQPGPSQNFYATNSVSSVAAYV